MVDCSYKAFLSDLLLRNVGIEHARSANLIRCILKFKKR